LDRLNIVLAWIQQVLFRLTITIENLNALYIRARLNFE
jgi:hypothetical protein